MRYTLCFLLLSALLLVAHCGDLKGEQLADAATKQALCNDGTAPVYYKHLVEGSTEWLIFLEGGGGCFNATDCIRRYHDSPRLMTASYDVIPRQVTDNGVLSLDCEVNPHFCKANIFFVHYCSSDLYAGEIEYPYQGAKAYFHGKRIVEEIVKQIVSLYSQINQATRIWLGGASAGSMGTQVNGDRIGALLVELIPNGKFSYFLLADSGWFQPGDGFRDNPCSKERCNVEFSIKQGSQFMNSQYSKACLAQYSDEQEWKCAFLCEEKSLPSINTPTFFVFNLHDSYQLGSDGIFGNNPSKYTDEETEWVKKREYETLSALHSFSDLRSKHGLFVPDCISHVITQSNSHINDIKVNGVSFNEALGEWLDGKEAIYVETDCGDELACNPNCHGKGVSFIE